VFLFLGGFLLGCHEVFFLRSNDLFSQGSRRGTLMPELLNFWYKQLSYHKILATRIQFVNKNLVPASAFGERPARARAKIRSKAGGES
jgi:hypothetical protein